MCNTCIHKIVCSKYIACGEVKTCEHFKEERKMVNLDDIVDLDAQTKKNNEAMRKVIDFMVGGADMKGD